MHRFNFIKEMDERITELTKKTLDKAARIEDLENNPQMYCSDDPENSCPADCTFCAKTTVSEWENEIYEWQTELEELRNWRDEHATHPDELINHFLQNHNGNVETVEKFLSEDDYDIFDDWDAYVEDYLDNLGNEIPHPIREYIDKDGLGRHLSRDMQWGEIGGMLYIFY